MSDIKKLVSRLETYNKAYRLGEPMVSDDIYDDMLGLLASMDPNNSFFDKVGLSNKRANYKLDVPMASMYKAKTYEELIKWYDNTFGKNDVELILTPKLDGISLGRDEVNNVSFTRGDGKMGQNVSLHYDMMMNKASYDAFLYTNGEVIIKRKTFIDLYSNEYSNPRNFVGGLLNSDDASIYLEDCSFIRYGAVPSNTKIFNTKKSILDELNSKQINKIDYICTTLNKITEDYLDKIFNKWSEEYDIDGIIIEANDIVLQNVIGRHHSTENPLYAIAYKAESFDKKVETEVVGIEWNISKRGKLKPIINVKSVNIDGVVVSNVTGNNARYVMNMGIGIGSKVIIRRSGMVIPQIVEVLNRVEFEVPKIGVDLRWDENGVDLETIELTEEQEIKNAISFFEILECDNIGEGVVRQLWESGLNSIEKIVKMTKEDMIHIPGFGNRKIDIVLESIEKGLNNVELSKLQHASGLFNNLGYKKLKKLEHFDKKPSEQDIIMIDGFAELSAKYYLESYDKYLQFISKIPHKLKSSVNSLESDILSEVKVVFSGIRDAELTKFIEANGGKVSTGGVTSTTTHLVMKELGTGSSKEVKAQKMGVEILNISDFKMKIKYDG